MDSACILLKHFAVYCFYGSFNHPPLQLLSVSFLVQVEVFGSYATGLYLPTSDIDVVIKYWEFDAQTPDVMQKALMTLEKQLINKGAYDDVKVIRTSVSLSS